MLKFPPFQPTRHKLAVLVDKSERLESVAVFLLS